MSDVTSVDPASVDPASVLFGLDDEFSLVDVTRVDATTVRVVMEQIVGEGACPACGVLSGRVKERPLVRVRDLPASGQSVQLWWHKRRLVCAEPACGRRSFTRRF